MNYDGVLFDAAETLFTTQGTVGEIYAGIALRFGSTASPEEIQKAFVTQFRHSGPVNTAEEKQWWKNVVHRVFTEVGMVEEFDRFFDEVYEQFKDSKGWKLFPETREVLQELSHRGLKLGVVSNFDSRIYSVMRSLGILQFFGSVTISSEAGYAKPDPRIFEVAARGLGFHPYRILFVGDSLVDDYQAGQAAGLYTLLIDRAGHYAAMKSVRRISSLREILAGNSGRR